MIRKKNSVKNALILYGILIMIKTFAWAGLAEDADGDGMPDWWESTFSTEGTAGLNPLKNDAQADPDQDSLANIDEFRYGTHPLYADTDEDLLPDGEEVYVYGTNPTIADTDSGGQSDGYEVANSRDPLNPHDDDAAASLTALIQLHPGWNLISLPVSPLSDAVSQVLAPISGAYASVWSYRKGIWKMYTPEAPGISDLTSLEAGWGYWINMNRSESLTISGTAPSDLVEFESGWNLIGYNSLNTQDTRQVFSSISGKYVSVWAFMDGTWKVYDSENPGLSDLTEIKPGYGYWVNVKDTCMWNLP
ncbi:MAG: hypothetical protein DRI57_11460 [Deltaproteobacteria bacterium]|nr:MAG: hypothetical protein DRI57_11460 [Deltaproteobacteria bacterium]